MPFNTYGYNAVFELRKDVVDRLLTRVWERNLVEVGGQVPNDEFITIDLGFEFGSKVVIYLRHGVPSCSFDPALQNTNTIDFRLPLECSVFAASSPAGGGDASNPWKRYAQNVDLCIKGLKMTKVTAGGASVVHPDFDSVTAQQLRICSPGTSDELDSMIDALFSLDNKLKFTAADLKEKIAGQLKNAVKDVDIEIPGAGLDLAGVQQWEFRVVSKNEAPSEYDGLDVLLYESDSKGKGRLEDAGNTIPQGIEPPYGFALSLGKDVLTTYFEQTLDRKGYYSQGGSLNTPSNPYGYMVVPSKGKPASYHLPAPPKGSGGSVVIGAPQGGTVTVDVAPKSLNHHSRGYLRNLDADTQVEFEAGSDGAASVSIAADPGQRLAITVFALTDPADTDTVIWRPKLALMGGKLHLDFRYYHYVDDWCDAHGDGWAEVAFDVDRTSVFDLTPRIVDKQVSLPWWVHVLGFLADAVTGGLANVIGATILAEVLSTQLVDEFVNQNLDKTLKDQLKFPTPATGRLGLFLERVDLYPTGMMLSGYVETGMIRHYGRVELKVKSATNLFAGSGQEMVPLGLLPTSNSTVKVVSTWSPSSAYIGADAIAKFWGSGYADAKKLTYGAGATEVQQGQPLLLWVQTYDAVTKFLVEWDPATGAALVTWVSYYEHVGPSVEIVNKIAAIQWSQQIGGGGYMYATRYDGWLELETVKFFRTAVSREAGLEKWYWNGKEIPQDGSLTDRGVLIRWDTKADRIIVTIDQAKYHAVSFPLPPPGEPHIEGLYTVENHLFQYKGQDIFGTPLSAQLSLYLPANVSSGLQFTLIQSLISVPPGVIPLPEPWAPRSLGATVSTRLSEGSDMPSHLLTEAILDRLHEAMGVDPSVQRLAASLSAALRLGKGTIGAVEANLLLSLIGPKSAPRS